jgi:hypothetical protein
MCAVSGRTLVYVSAVSTMVERPSWSSTTFRSVPAASARVAAPCRSPYRVTGGSPEAVTSLRNRRVSQSGLTGLPVSVVNT